MDLKTGSGSPREEGELEDGEICDDESEESVPLRRGDGSRPGRGAPPRPRKPLQHPLDLPPLLGPHHLGPHHLGPQHLGHLLMPYTRGPHGPFPPGHRQQCGPSGPDRPPVAPTAPPGLGPHGEPSPRSSFWERSHGALGRFRHRGMPNGGRGGWGRGGRGGRGPPGRYGPGESHGNKKESPPRKRILPDR